MISRSNCTKAQTSRPQYETKARVCDEGLKGEMIDLNNTCSAFALMLTGSAVAFIIGIHERFMSRAKEFPEKKVKWSVHSEKRTPGLSPDNHRFDVRARTKLVVNDES